MWNHTSLNLSTPRMVKVTCTLLQALRLCTGRTAHREIRGIALLIHDHGTRRGWGVSVTPRPLFTPGKDPLPIVQEACWAPGPVWTGAENLASTGIRSPDRPALSQSLYRLSYPAHTPYGTLGKFIIEFVCVLWYFHVPVWFQCVRKCRESKRCTSSAALTCHQRRSAVSAF